MGFNSGLKGLNMIGAKTFNSAVSNLFISSRKKIKASVFALGLLKMFCSSTFQPRPCV
jgi:hypothetical protein